MELTNKQLLAAILVPAFIGLAVGRYATPAKTEIKIQEKVVVKEVVKWKTKYVKSQKNDKETIIVETKYPDGTVKKEKRIVDRGTLQVDLTKEGSKSKDSTSTKESDTKISSNTNDWHVSVMATNSYSEHNVLSDKMSYGIHAERRIIGPFYLGVFGITNQTFGGSIGVTF